jgi:hypothetical protein
MNERFKQLAEQATRTAMWPGDPEAGELNAEKFAELIVRECLDVVAMRIYLGPEEICRQECKALASEIKEHFGVDE